MNREEPAITLDVADGVARIVLNRPRTGNGIGIDFVDALESITLACSERDDLRAVVLSSVGQRFCVGGDIRAMTAGLGEMTLPSYIRRCNASLQGSLARLHHLAAPSIAIVQGVAAGGGVSLLAGFDIVVAADSARFVAAYAGIGYCPDMGGSTMVTRRMGVARARRFYLLHEELSAAEAVQSGLVDFAVAPDALVGVADRIVQRWAQGPTAAYGAIRRLMRSAATESLESQMELETQEIAALARGDDAVGALRAFVEKRHAEFRGR